MYAVLKLVFLSFCVVGQGFVGGAPATEIKTGELGQQVQLRCDLPAGTDSGHILWYHKSNVVSMGGNSWFPDDYSVTASHGSSTLTIIRATLEREGIYKCQTRGAKDPIKQYEFIIVSKPVVTVKPRNTSLDVRVGETLTLICQATGKPAPTVKWIKKGRYQDEEFENLVNGTLTLHNTTKKNAGSYLCEAENLGGTEESREIKVNMLYAPSIRAEHPVVQTAGGRRAVMKCYVSGSPDPRVSWNHKGHGVGGELNVTKMREGEFVYELAVASYSDDNEGIYEFVAVNEYGNDSAQVKLTAEPLNLKVTSKKRGEYSDTYTITFSVESIEEMINVELLVREISSDNVTLMNATVTRENARDHKYKGEYKIFNLEANGTYGVRLRATNVDSSTSWTKEFIFKTAKEHNPAPIITTSLPTQPPTTGEANGDHQTPDNGENGNIAGAASYMTMNKKMLLTSLLLWLRASY